MDKTQAETWMREAIQEARRGELLGEVPVGAVLVQNGVILARAHNLVETNHDATAHAELLVIREAAKKLSSWRLSECSLIVTLEPCPMCMGAIVLSRIPRVYFGAWDPRMGAAGSRFDLSNYPEFPHAVEMFPEVLKDECESVLKVFFESRRNLAEK